MATYKQVKDKFNGLTPKGKEALIKEIYNFSKETKLFLENRLVGGKDEEFIKAMEKETIGKVYKRGIPGTPDGRKVNSIITRAKKSAVSNWTLIKLEQLAYRGFIEFLNEYGGGPDNFDDMACNHLEEYLNLVKSEVASQEGKIKIFQEIRDYLLKKGNMYSESLDDIFEMITGISV